MFSAFLLVTLNDIFYALLCLHFRNVSLHCGRLRFTVPTLYLVWNTQHHMHFVRLLALDFIRSQCMIYQLVYSVPGFLLQPLLLELFLGRLLISFFAYDLDTCVGSFFLFAKYGRLDLPFWIIIAST